MHQNKRWIFVILFTLMALPLVACGQSVETMVDVVSAAIVEPIEGTEFNSITLTEKAAERLGIETTQVQEEEIDGRQRMRIPYSSIIYDVNGNTWAYVTSEPLTFVRESITVDYIQGNNVILTNGPPVGVEVVTVGVAELYGVDTGVGK